MTFIEVGNLEEEEIGLKELLMVHFIHVKFEIQIRLHIEISSRWLNM
jgi:hypothetical protein